MTDEDEHHDDAVATEAMYESLGGLPDLNACMEVVKDKFGSVETGPRGYVSLGVAQFADLTTRVSNLEELARRVVKQSHTITCWRKRGPERACTCLVALAKRALGED